MLTPDPAKRPARALAAAQAKVQAGAVDAGLDLLAMAETGPLGELDRADLVRPLAAYVTRRGSDAPPLLLAAAKSGRGRFVPDCRRGAGRPPVVQVRPAVCGRARLRRGSRG